MPKEAGTVKFNPKPAKGQQKIELQPQFTLQTTPDEHQDAVQSLKGHLPEDTSLEDHPDRILSITKQQLIKCTDKFNSSSGWLKFLATAIGIDFTAQTGTMYFTGQFTTKPKQVNSAARLSWIVVVDMQVKALDIVIIDNISSKLVPILIKYPVVCFDRTWNEKWVKAWNDTFLSDSKTWGESWSKAKEDFSFRDSPNANQAKSAKERSAEANAEANFEANLVKIPITTSLDIFLLKGAGKLLAKVCQVNPRMSWIVSGKTLRAVERAGSGVATAMYISYKTGPVLKEIQEEEANPGKLRSESVGPEKPSIGDYVCSPEKTFEAIREKLSEVKANLN
jgi:hypothetical protein